ncbi:hypothetical protein FM106_31255 [Brachybacterium faecium]|nr:hypothetical protein FM106_31255 [Brachybacterium faecium]
MLHIKREKLFERIKPTNSSFYISLCLLCHTNYNKKYHCIILLLTVMAVYSVL